MKYLQKYASVISLSLLIALIITLVFNQSLISLISNTLIIFAVGTAILFTIHSNWQTKQNDKLTNAQFPRNTALDLLGLTLTMGVAMGLGRMAGGYAGQAWGMIAGIVAGIAVGFGAELVVGKVWGSISNRFRAGAIL